MRGAPIRRNRCATRRVIPWGWAGMRLAIQGREEATMFRKILCATDLTPTSKPALRAAFDLGRKLDAMGYVLYVVEPPYRAVPWFVPASLEQDVLQTLFARQEEAAIEQLKLAIGPLAVEGARAEPLVRTGGPVDSILSAAKDVGAELIIVGTHGRTGLAHLALGSVAERVVRTAAIPVLTVRSQS
jgi:universal stress protein A